uniref:NADH-ubiquinone oxidoreductase chain 4 n=1 Tax=Mirax sp. QL-2014 TaxID=1491721 RepID=A0A0U1WYH8_9HYME|nr:NADH dehydrogenase subunit 4 [Mirax sp. QL-2014]
MMMKFIMFLFIMIYMNYKNKFMLTNFMMILNLTMLWIMNFPNNNYYFNKIYYMFMLDKLSFNLILLSLWIVTLSILSNKQFTKKLFNYQFMFLLSILIFILVNCFLSMNMFLFYIFFEASILPIMMLIMGWGMQIDRLQASMYMLFYTLIGSLPLLLMLFILYKSYLSLMFNFMSLKNLNMINFMMYMFMIMAFLIKMPMYMLHLWLPKAHVEAPVSGSMILAGIMLKLGSYGLIRLMFISYTLFSKYNFIIINTSLIGGLIASMICLNINDFKIIVAYSSIVHMSTLMSSMMTFFKWGYISSYIMMIAHGLCSSSMFSLVNFNYERLHSRSTLMNKGLMNLYPSMCLWWFLICICNMAAPPSMNLISEIMIFISLINWSKFLIMYMFFMTFFSSCYSIFIYSFTQHGKLSFNLFNFNFNSIQEYLINIMHWMPINLIILNLNLLI